MILGMEVGHCPGNTVSDGDPAPTSRKGAQQPLQCAEYVNISQYVSSAFIELLLYVIWSFIYFGHLCEYVRNQKQSWFIAKLFYRDISSYYMHILYRDCSVVGWVITWLVGHMLAVW